MSERKRINLDISAEEWETLQLLAVQLDSERRKGKGPKSSVAITQVVRDMMAVAGLVLRDYPGIVRQALPAVEHDNGSSQ